MKTHYSKLVIDIETYSGISLKESGLFKYTEDPDFSILLFGYAFDDEEVRGVDMAQGQKVPDEVIEALKDDSILKIAHNAFFEMTCISKAFNIKINPLAWRDTMIMAYYGSYPGALGEVGKLLNLTEQKDTAGKMLINYFSVPCKPTRSNCGRTRNLPEHDKDKWNLYMLYNLQDVETERELYNKLLKIVDVPTHVWREWACDYTINSRGVKLDKELINGVINIATDIENNLVKVSQEITKLENPNSPTQLKAWLTKKLGYEVSSVAKGTEFKTDDEEVLKVLANRSELGKSSMSKYEAMLNCMCSDNKARGLLQFYGASRTGRWAGRLVQVQNLPRNYIKDLDLARELAKTKDTELFKFFYDTPMDTLSQLIRTAFIPSKDKFIISDYSAIEARVIAWLAKEEWVNEVFRTHGKIYEATASQMFHVPIEEVTKDLRAKGKVATLALGYQGSSGALIAMGALKNGLTEVELPAIVQKWRKANPHIVKLWSDVENAAKDAILNPTHMFRLKQNDDVRFVYSNRRLHIYLPSGRCLIYVNATVSDGGRVHYEAMATEEGGSARAWCKTSTYGGHLVENIVQAIARDCLAYNILKLEEKGYEIVMHIHDEVVIDATNEQKLDDVIKIMGEEIPWAKGLYLTAAGFESKYYQKD